MAKTCTICGKTSTVVWKLRKLRGKYNPTSKKRKYPNLQWVIISAGIKYPKKARPFRGKRVLACAKCIKALAKNK
ncbi:hypothetical protein KKC00_00165 [Patescibacteria group bacterium]|nr:hypothetical protein [Patescibacteria group bacterium]